MSLRLYTRIYACGVGKYLYTYTPKKSIVIPSFFLPKTYRWPLKKPIQYNKGGRKGRVRSVRPDPNWVDGAGKGLLDETVLSGVERGYPGPNSAAPIPLRWPRVNRRLTIRLNRSGRGRSASRRADPLQIWHLSTQKIHRVKIRHCIMLDFPWYKGYTCLVSRAGTGVIQTKE